MKKSFFVGLLATLALSGDEKTKRYPSQSDKPIITVSQGTYPAADVFSFTDGSSTTASSVAQATSMAFQNAASNIGGRVNRSIDSLFLRLPSASQLDQLILNADSVALLKTIQTVATDDSLTCDQRIAYLLQVLGRIRSAVEMKTFAVDQLQTIIQGATDEIARLQAEIDRLQGQIKNLWLDELRDQLADAVAKLEDLYFQFNAVEANIAPNEARVTGYQKEIAILTNANDGERNRISNDRLKLTQADANIRDLQGQLAAARDRKAALSASIKRSQDSIAANLVKIQDARKEIADLQDEIRRLRDQVDRLRSKYNDIEIQVERLRTDISVAENKADRYRAQIRDLQDRINDEQKKLVPDQVDDLQNMIQKLERLIPRVKAEIDRHYYYCYGQGAVTIEQTGGVVVYIVKGERFGDYLRNQYGAGVELPGLRGDVTLNSIDIFSPLWTSRFGYPYTQGSLGGSSFDVSGSFSCLNPSLAQQGTGTIAAIGADYIDIKPKLGGQNRRLHIGSCSRLQAVSQLPQIGQNIAYVGVPSAADGYNLYQASCW